MYLAVLYYNHMIRKRMLMIKMKPRKAELLLIMVTLFWGSSYIFMKWAWIH